MLTFLSQAPKETQRQPQRSGKQQLYYDQKDKLKDYITTFSKTNGALKVKQRQLIHVCRQYVLFLLFWYDPATALKNAPPMGVKEELKAILFEKACICTVEKDTERRNKPVEFKNLSVKMGEKSHFS